MSTLAQALPDTAQTIFASESSFPEEIETPMENAIEELYQIFTARHEYNVFLATSLSERRPNTKKNRILAECVKDSGANTFLQHAKFYTECLELLKSTESTESNQSSIDNLFCKLTERHCIEEGVFNMALKSIKLKKRREFAHEADTLQTNESLFILECIQLLSPHISPQEQGFLENYRPTFIESTEGRAGLCWHKVSDWEIQFLNSEIELSEKMNNLNSRLQLTLKSSEENLDNMQLFFNSLTLIIELCEETAVPVSSIERALVTIGSSPREKYLQCYPLIQTWKACSNRFNIIEARLEAKLPKAEEIQKQETPIPTLVSSESPKQKRVKAKKAKPRSVTTKVEAEALSASSSETVAKISSPNPEPTPDIHAEKRQQDAAYRESVRLAREQRAAEKRAARMLQTSSQASSPQSEVIALTPFTTLLLKNLNSNHFELLESLFETPPPTHISYRNIESLIGLEPGKLLGKLSTPPHGSSHRKIEIGGIQGYFDADDTDINEDATEAQTTTVTGGTFRPHGKAHGGPLPRIAITMLRQILERAGINAAVLRVFNTSRTIVDHNPPDPVVFSSAAKGKTIELELDAILDSTRTLRTLSLS